MNKREKIKLIVFGMKLFRKFKLNILFFKIYSNATNENMILKLIQQCIKNIYIIKINKSKSLIT
jgi:hypothetical protein